MKTVRSTFLVLAGSALLFSAGCCDRARVERVEQPDAWKLIPVCGKTFYNHNTGWSKPWMLELWQNCKDEPMYENVWLEMGGFRWKGNKWQFSHIYANDEDRKRGKFKEWGLLPTKPVDPMEKPPLKITNLLKRGNFAKILDWFLKEKPGAPFSFGCGIRPVWPLTGEFDIDHEDFAKWVAKYPNFMGFGSFDEFDHDLMQIRGDWHRKMYRNPETAAWMDGEYPVSENLNDDLVGWMDKIYPKAKAYHFGTKQTGLWANVPSMIFTLVPHGLSFLWYEAEMQQNGSPWRWGGMFSRGAARQFKVPYGWYMAGFNLGQVPKPGTTLPKFEKRLPGDEYPTPLYPRKGRMEVRQNLGCGRSLLKRNTFYGCAIGAVTICYEGSSELFSTVDPADTNKVVLSPFGKDFNEIYRWEKTHDRGVVYTPVALLTSRYEHFNRQASVCRHNRDPFSQIAFLTALTCPKMDPVYCQEPEKGNPGEMFNYEFGEFVDAVCPDSGQNSDDFHAFLSNYKAAILCGWFNAERFDRKALARYVAGGGVVYAEKRHVEMGLVPESVPGAKGRIEIVDSFLNPVVTDGKGDIYKDKITGMFKGTIKNPVIENLYRRLQDEYMPVKVEGSIQFGVNLAKNGWLVWLINNDGVKKWSHLPEEYDLSKTSTVKITHKKSGKVFTATVKPGDYASVEIPFD